MPPTEVLDPHGGGLRLAGELAGADEGQGLLARHDHAHTAADGLDLPATESGVVADPAAVGDHLVGAPGGGPRGARLGDEGDDKRVGLIGLEHVDLQSARFVSGRNGSRGPSRSGEGPQGDRVEAWGAPGAALP